MSNYISNNISTTVSKEKRKPWIDSMRGICILLVVLGHSIGVLNDPLNRFILSFHMPAFFFISGLVAKVDLPFRNYLFKKAKTLLIPQLTFAVINIGWNVLVEKTVLTGAMIISSLFSWFLVVLFYIAILFWLLNRLNVISHKLACLIAFLILTFIIQYTKFETFISIEIIPAAMFFYLIGFYCRDKIENHLNSPMASCWIFAVPLVVIISYWNKPIAMYMVCYGNLFLFFTGAMLGVWCLVGLSMELHNKPLQWFGCNSLIIYILHPKILKVLHGLGKIIFPAIEGETYAYPGHWHFFFATMLVLIPIVYICNRFIPEVFGKKRASIKKD